MIAHGFRYTLEPLPVQEVLFRQFAGLCRLVSNFALERRATWGRRHRLGYLQQAADLTRVRLRASADAEAGTKQERLGR